MNDADRFETILAELKRVLLDISTTGVDTILVGGQVLALEARAAGASGVIEVTTGTGVTIQRGFSFEPDLLLDVDSAGDRAELVIDVLKRNAFHRARSFRWSKQLPGGIELAVDLFVPADADAVNNPAHLTALPRGDLALARPRTLSVMLSTGELRIKVPDPAGFIGMKLEAKQRLRPNETKDSFDIYAYVVLKGPHVVANALSTSHEGPSLMASLKTLFGTPDAAGVLDVVDTAGLLDEAEASLLARAVVDTFDEVLRSVSFPS